MNDIETAQRQLTVLLPHRLWARARDLAQRRDEPVVAVVRAALEAYLATHEDSTRTTTAA